MCGIVGAIGDFDLSHAKVFDQLVFLDTIRGPHSTGLASVSMSTKRAAVYKTMSPGPQAIQEDGWKSTRGLHHGVWLGHNRYATQGKIDLDNAHPFTHEHITGVHNGTLDWGWEWDMRPLGAPTFGTDSETIYWCIANHGLEETLAHVQGDFALVYYDAEDHSMNFMHNGTRPLHYGRTLNGKALYFSSLAEILWTVEAQGRSSASVLDTVYEFKKDLHYKLKLPNAQKDLKFEKGWEWDSVEPIEHGTEIQTKSYSTYHYNGNNYDWDTGTVIGGSKSTSKKTSPSGNSGSSNGLDVYTKFLQRDGKRLDNWEYVDFIFKSMPSDQKAHDVLSNNYEKLNLNTTLQHPTSQVVSYSPNQMKQFTNRLQQLRVMEDQIKAFDGSWDYYKTAEAEVDDLVDLRSKFIKIQTQPCFNCRTIDIGGQLNWKPEECEFMPDESYLCPDCAQMPCFQIYLDQIRDEINQAS